MQSATVSLVANKIDSGIDSIKHTEQTLNENNTANLKITGYYTETSITSLHCD